MNVLMQPLANGSSPDGARSVFSIQLLDDLSQGKLVPMEKTAYFVDLPIQKLLQEGDRTRLVPGVDGCVVAHYSLQSVDAVILRQHAVELHGMGDTGACVEDLMREILASQWT